ncbi:hypothetical protein BUALT_Bualt15G0019200 [Buddleja alternifolia]|uniref:RRM domain-containing protein n=1 Tax=Buddleja alternifolia TaxID=168488 RepID=A0AAV6WC03_9LAMI|nr:hypothetical protein BUALT_Bualt15G0019200 [Buddleja alternifolia]
MSPSTNSISRPKTLNHRAPEYNPIPPGITPNSHAPPPFPLPWPCYAAIHHRLPPPPPPASPSLAPPPPLVWSPEICSYVIPSVVPHTTKQQPFYPNYTFTPQNPVATNPSPPPHPPQPGRGCPGQRGEIRAGRGRENSWTRDERVYNGRGSNYNLKFQRRVEYSNDDYKRNNVGFRRDDEKCCRWGMQKEESRHKVTPLKRDEEKTTIMIKNIPYDFPRQELINVLDGFCKMENAKSRNEGTSQEDVIYAYDFLYLPIDFKTNKGRGFAFVNFTNASAVWRFFDTFHLKTWDFVQYNKWPKKIVIASAKIQKALVKQFSGSTFECGTNEFLPVCFYPPRDGSGQPVELTVIGKRSSNKRAVSHRETRNNHKA